MEVKHTNTVIRGNMFPFSFPREVFQFEMEFSEVEKLWQTVKELTANSTIVAAPLKKLVYALGTLSDIHNVFGNRIKSEVSRTPVTAEELKIQTVFKNLYRKAIINGICQVYSLINDSFEKIWKATDKKSIVVGIDTFEIFEAAKISLFFDHKYAYISLQRDFALTDFAKLSKDR